MNPRTAFLLLGQFLCSLVFTTLLCADISLPKLFSDHMVLQQNRTIKVWGTADPNEELSITFSDFTGNAIADKDGHWSTSIKTGPAGGPYQLEIASKSSGTKVIVTDIMLGEVWICSGQSNMEWPVNKSLNPEVEIAEAKNYPNIRFFTVKHSAVSTPQSEFLDVHPWVCCSSESVKSFSAVAYQFAKRLGKDMENTPIGLIHTSWGGTRCEAWTAQHALNADPFFKPLLDSWKDKDDPVSRHRPGNLYNGMIAPLKEYAFQGVIWYQGEANVGRGAQYQKLFPALIKNWRTELVQSDLKKEDRDFPFYFVQLAPFRYGGGQVPQALAEVRDAQLKTLKSVKNTGMIVTTDIGNVKDIHPKNKQELGRRLALQALARIYKASIESPPESYSSPIYKSMELIDGEIYIGFDHVGEELQVRGNESISHFTICGEDKKFHPATARIEGKLIIVSSPNVKDPIAVRFAWDDTAVPNIFNQAGLPVSPFRTDDFELLSKGVNF